ncbi:MAG: T9SS type A sorting domain-containing protein, partial [Bacteroidales bacterium]|nr:T9SS type A sorting domain-containing protein [Bacteroidales bacterium]
VKVSVHDGIETLENSAITIYPNPNKGNFSLDFNNINGKVSYQIIDTKGSVIVSNNSFVDGNAMIEVSLDLASGVYFVKVITETQSLIEKLVIE